MQLVNIGDIDSAVAREHGIEFVPNFRITAADGRQIAFGKAADQWLRREIQRREARAR